MSLILYNGSNESIHEDQQVYSLVINNTMLTRVLFNSDTNEVSIVATEEESQHDGFRARRSSFHQMRCPHCGSTFSGVPFSPASAEAPHSAGPEVNYFRLLESSVNSVDGLFAQGYFKKFFKKMAFLGNGSNGSVFKVEHMLNDVSLGVFALKKITVGTDERLLERTLREVKMLSQISAKSPNLVSYNHVWFEIDRINEFGPEVPCAFILEQYCPGGNLEDLLTELRNPPWTVHDLKKHKHRKPQGRLLTNMEIFYIFRDICRGLLELHRNGIIHRDLKPSNILLTRKYCEDAYNNGENLEVLPSVVIGDFGESQFLGEKRTGTGFTGTIEYSAPEVFLSPIAGARAEFNEMTDMFSMGMILYFLCYSDLPSSTISAVELDTFFKEVSGEEELDAMYQRATEFTINTREGLNPKYNELIRQLTSRDPAERPSSEELLKVLEILENDLMAVIDDVDELDVEEYQELEENNPLYEYITMIVQVVELMIIIGFFELRTSHLTYALLFLSGASMRGRQAHRITLVVLMALVIAIEYTGGLHTPYKCIKYYYRD